MKTRIGYFIPEFPGQTHIFFWREQQILTDLGIEADWVSTRRPPKGIVSHSWADEASKKTDYLVPITMGDFVNASVAILKAGLFKWLNCLKIVFQARRMSLSQKLRLLAMIFVAGKLAWLATKKNWSHVHVHSCADAANIAMFASRLSDLSYSLTLHGPTLEVYGPNQEQKWKYASFAFVVSEKLLKDVQNKLTGCLPEQITVVPMGVNLEKIKRQILYLPWEGNGSCKIFACGRLNPVKGHKYLIEAVDLLRQGGFDVYLQIAGEDEQGGSGYRQELEKIIQEKSLSPYIELLGAVSEEYVRQCLEKAHIFTLASLNEGVPVAVMEAMAMEVPIVVTDVGGTSELVEHEVDGILVQPEKVKEMAEAIARVLENKELALSLSQKSRQKVITKFHHRRSAELLAHCLSVRA